MNSVDLVMDIQQLQKSLEEIKVKVVALCIQLDTLPPNADGDLITLGSTHWIRRKSDE